MRRSLLALCLMGSVCAALTAQQPVFRSGVQYVTVDVVVTDKNDHPITDLKKEDFAIVEGGKTQTVADFQFVSVPTTTRTVNLVPTANAPEPDVVSNTAPTPESRLFVIVVDDLHLIEQDIIRIKESLSNMLGAFAPEDEVALVFVSHSDMSVNFTRNRAALAAVIDHVRGALGFGLDSLAQQPAGETPSANALYPSTVPSRFRLAYQKNVVDTLINVTRSLSGAQYARRAVFFFSGGTTLEPHDPTDPNYNIEYGEDLRAVIGAAQRSGVPIYAIDPRGNLTPDDAVRGHQIVTERVRAQVRRNLQIQRNNMSELAINTGGRAIVGASDMKRMMQEVVQENSSFYLLGYYPEPFSADGKFHDISVKVNRPGAIVRARTGYVAPSASRATESTASVLNTAMSAGVNVSGLPIRVSALPIAAAAKGMMTAVTVEVTYPAPMDGSRRIDDSLELSLVALDPDAKVLLKASRPMKFAGTAPPSGAITFLLDEALELPSQPLTLRVGIASQALGKAGTAQVALEVPKPSDGKLQMSGVAIGLDGPKREAVMNGQLISALLPFQPTTTRVFRRDDTLRGFLRLFWKGKDQPTVTITTVGGAAPASKATQAIRVQAADGGRMEAVVDTTIPLKDLLPGRYHLAIDATLPNGQAVSRVVLFEVQ